MSDKLKFVSEYMDNSFGVSISLENFKRVKQI